MLRLLTLLLLASCLRAPGQEARPATPFDPHDPKDYFDAASPVYSFNDSDLKPWHLKASYQIYGQDSMPIGQGTYERWWASPKVYRNTWNRTGSTEKATHNDWQTADGKHAYSGDGHLDYFEYGLQSALLSPLPKEAELDPSQYRLEQQSLTMGPVKMQCIKVIPHMAPHGRTQEVPLGLFPTYCFNDKTPILRVEFSWGSLTIEFNKIAKVQGRYLAREIAIFEGKRKILIASVDTVEGISPTDPALVPPPELPVTPIDRVQIVAGISNGMLLKKVTPVYPQDAKDARVSGTVVLEGVIGRDGVVHDLRVLQTPWPSLAASALWSVSQWRYKPYLLNGAPVEVKTTINVIYTLSG